MTRLNRHGQPIGVPVPGWHPPPRPPRERIEGRYCVLDPVREEHAAALFAAYHEAPDDRDWTYLFHERPAEEAAFRRYLAALEHSEDPLHFSILAGGEPLGTAALMRIDPAHGSIEVGSIT
ncbi:MAG: GNAT family N-acetyltransferase, partial [Gammaproteobacteria bacterium]|nr:GNAT family N-acetyltransferase [Gammaproteobacteria bacterium]